ncbi:2-keto-3-deoxy-galactonokinase [Amylibacter marinus]|uniref:2-keto-3-deoxy-galactonokinase n=1 Tax=Amylibacter marinus TaxID=1475483 RepID=A0ABQ5VY02_9RHOB|nr:2-dehydro-3-deoxygalactonokinase [Amylibacter marinus]GLQ36174.1 2-keto-3-deoxy-galactonokinase [Amylibacter marinus]
MAIKWVALDWGTTNLIAYAIGEEGVIIDRIHSNKGMSQLAPSEFEATLLNVIRDWLSDNHCMQVVACGMVGARQGWLEAAYSQVPCSPVEMASVVDAPTNDPRLSVRIVPGVCQREPDDIMRGEETQIAGYLAKNPSFSGTICLPGTHSKWARVTHGKVQSFTTFMTGELFDLLTRHSVLRFCTASDEWDDSAFLKGVETAMLNSDRLTAHLFGLRPRGLLSGTDNGLLRAHLSGLLIGAEITAMREMWRGQDVVIIGDPGNSRLYQIALAQNDLAPLIYDGALAIVDGLTPVANAWACARGCA